MVAKWPSLALPKLVQAITDGKCVAFIGAGLSRDAGFPGWAGLTMRLASLCADLKRYNQEFLSEVHRLAETTDLRLIEWLQRAHFSDYQWLLEDIFPTDISSYEHTKTHRLMLQLGFRGYVTTNYDLCLESAAAHEGEHVVSCSYADLDSAAILNPSNKFICHIHGRAASQDELIITPSDYYEVYSQTNLRKTLESLFSEYSALFVGYSFRDYEIRNILENLAHAYRDASRWRNAREHFAVLGKQPDDTCTELREQLDADMLKTRAIYYTAYPLEDRDRYGEREDHRELHELLVELKQAVDSSITPMFGKDQHASKDADRLMKRP